MCTGALLPSLTTIPQLRACVGKAPKDYDSERLSQDFHCSGAIVCLFVEFSMQLIYEILNKPTAEGNRPGCHRRKHLLLLLLLGAFSKRTCDFTTGPTNQLCDMM